VHASHKIFVFQALQIKTACVIADIQATTTLQGANRGIEDVIVKSALKFFSIKLLSPARVLLSICGQRVPWEMVQ
jgi:hypothetical protein